MKIRTLVLAAGLWGAALLGPCANAQPAWDTVHVTLPDPVTMGSKVMPPGEYTVKQLPGDEASRVLVFYGDHGMKFLASAVTVRTLGEQFTPPTTAVTLYHVGDAYYLNKISVSGNYEYLFPVPPNAELERGGTH